MDNSNNILDISRDLTVEMDNWFNELDENTIEIINHINQSNNSPNNNNSNNPSKEDDIIEKEHLIECKNLEDSQIKLEEYCIEDILDKDISKLTSKEIIQYECIISYFIQVLIEGTSTNKIKSMKNYDTYLSFDKINDIIGYLTWLSNTCEFLAKRINQDVLEYIYEGTPTIVRSSYNFCTKYTQCKNFYSRHEKPTCKEHHYVHSLLKYDIDSVRSFLTYVINNHIEISRKNLANSLLKEDMDSVRSFLTYIINNPIEISKECLTNLFLSIKTICFVIRHMEKEISYIDYITKNNSEAFHRNNPMDMFRKKLTLKKEYTDGSTTMRDKNKRDKNERNERNEKNERPECKDQKSNSYKSVNRTNTNKTTYNKSNKCLKTKSDKSYLSKTNNYHTHGDFKVIPEMSQINTNNTPNRYSVLADY